MAPGRLGLRVVLMDCEALMASRSVPSALRESMSRASEWCEVSWALGESMSGGSEWCEVPGRHGTQARLAAGSANQRSASKSGDTEASRSSGEVSAAANTARASSRYVGSTSTPARAMWRG